MICQELIGHGDSVDSIAFSVDGRTLASGSSDGTIRIWDAVEGKEVRTIKWSVVKPDKGGRVRSVCALAFSPDGKTLASGARDSGTVCLWDVVTGRKVRSLDCEEELTAKTISFSPNGEVIAAGTDWGTIGIWSVQTGKLLHRIHGHRRAVNSICFSPDGKTLASGSEDCHVRMWDVVSGKELPRPPAHSANMRAVAFSPGGDLIATHGEDPSSWGADDTVFVWRTDTGEQVRSMPTGSPDLPRCVNSPVLFSSTSRLWTVCSLCSLALWDPLTNSLDRTKMLVPGAAVDTAGRFTDVSMAATPSGDTLAIKAPRQEAAADVAFRKEMTTGEVAAVSGSYLAPIAIWDTKLQKKKQTVQVPYRSFFARAGHWPISGGSDMCLSADGKLLATTSPIPRMISLWDVRSGKMHGQLLRHKAAVNDLAFSPSGRLLVSASGETESHGFAVDPSIRFWDVASGTELHCMKLKDDRDFSQLFGRGLPHSVAFSPDGRFVASAHDNGSVRVWEVASCEVLVEWREKGTGANHVAFSPLGDIVASAHTDGAALVWSIDKSVLGGTPPQAKQRSVEVLWSRLRSDYVGTAYQAEYELAQRPRESIPFLKGRLKRIPQVDPEVLQKLVADLDSDVFRLREHASRELLLYKVQAEHLLRAALAKTKSREVQFRAKRILSQLQRWLITDPEKLRILRAVRVLQRIGSPEARAILEDLAQGASEERLTQEARSALAFLNSRPRAK
jgi:WD40 repeat protein